MNEQGCRMKALMLVGVNTGSYFLLPGKSINDFSLCCCEKYLMQSYSIFIGLQKKQGSQLGGEEGRLLLLKTPTGHLHSQFKHRNHYNMNETTLFCLLHSTCLLWAHSILLCISTGLSASSLLNHGHSVFAFDHPKKWMNLLLRWIKFIRYKSTSYKRILSDDELSDS